MGETTTGGAVFSCEGERADYRAETGNDPDAATQAMLLTWLGKREATLSAHPTLPLAGGRRVHTDMRSARRSRKR